jgi:hypothetical protein
MRLLWLVKVAIEGNLVADFAGLLVYPRFRHLRQVLTTEGCPNPAGLHHAHPTLSEAVGEAMEKDFRKAIHILNN